MTTFHHSSSVGECHVALDEGRFSASSACRKGKMSRSSRQEHGYRNTELLGKMDSADELDGGVFSAAENAALGGEAQRQIFE